MKRMNTKKAGALALTALLLTAPAGALGFGLEYVSEEQLLQEEALESAWDYPLSYESLMESDYLALANRDSLLDKDYKPADLVKIKARKVSSDPIQMRKAASEAMSAMFDAALEDGVKLYASSGYRSYQTQNTMYYNRLKKNGGKDDKVVAYPGSSDHQTGLGIDIINYSGIGKRFTSAFADTKEGKWLAENCWDYGFILRYAKEKEDITQIIYEPWHFRYVGLEPALYMRDNDLSLEEFTAEWHDAVTAFDGTEFTAVSVEDMENAK